MAAARARRRDQPGETRPGQAGHSRCPAGHRSPGTGPVSHIACPGLRSPAAVPATAIVLSVQYCFRSAIRAGGRLSRVGVVGYHRWQYHEELPMSEQVPLGVVEAVVRRGSHICPLFSRSAQRDRVVPVLAEGIRCGHKCVAVLAAPGPRDLLTRLGGQVDLDDSAETGPPKLPARPTRTCAHASSPPRTC